MGWPNNFVQGVYDSTGKVVGVDDGDGGVVRFSFGVQIGLPVGIPPAGTIGSNGDLKLGTLVGGGTITFGSTSGSTSCTATAPAFAATDVGRVITVDGVKQATITGYTSTTVVTVTLGSTLSGVGPFAVWYMAWPFHNTYSNIYLYFPANAIFAGSSSGFYYVEMSSTTTGKVYNNLYLAAANEVPIIPTPIAFSGTTGINYTQDTANITGVAFNIPAGRMGKNGEVRTQSLVSRSKSTATVQYNENFNAQYAYIAGLPGSSVLNIMNMVIVKNRGSVAQQITTPNQVGSLYSGAIQQPYRLMAHNTDAIDVPYQAMFQVSTAGTWIILESFDLEVLPSL